MGPPRPRLSEGILEVWHADLDAAGDAVLRLLSPEEQARAARFPAALKGTLWARARGLLRTLLATYLDEDPRRLRFETGAGGKPLLADQASHRIAFNLSHSASHALFAFMHAGAVGVDVERARPGADRLSLAEHAFGAAAARRLEPLQPAAREREFLSMWVRREALVKYTGRGIWEAPASHGASHDTADEHGASKRTSPWIASLELGPNMAGAVASAEPPLVLRCWKWRDERHSRLAAPGGQLAAPN